MISMVMTLPFLLGLLAGWILCHLYKKRTGG